MKISLYLISFFILLVLFMYIRNRWICRQRKILLEQNYGGLKYYLGYYKMLVRFWIWDINKLKIQR